MHELSVIAGLFETLLDKAREYDAHRITFVRLQVGCLSGVVPELLESAFDVSKKGTIAENAALEIVRLPYTVRCRACGREAVREDFIFACPACGSTDMEIVQGTELVLERIEVEAG